MTKIENVICDTGQDYQNDSPEIDFVDRIYGEGGLLDKNLNGYIEREGQKRLSRSVLKCLQTGKTGLFEAPTGSGKSLGYLFPLMHKLANNPQERAIISTSGITLQSQIVNKDAPFAQRFVSKPISYCLLKGRNNFLCKAKFSKLTDKSNTNFSKENLERLISKNLFENADLRNLSNKINSWGKTTTTGEKQSLGEYIPNSLWRHYSCVDNDECNGKACPYMSECFYRKARSEAAAAQLVITNHHMVCADLLTDHGILGSYNSIIFDEGHDLEEIMKDFFEIKLSRNTLKKTIQVLANKENVLNTVIPEDIVHLLGFERRKRSDGEIYYEEIAPYYGLQRYFQDMFSYIDNCLAIKKRDESTSKFKSDQLSFAIIGDVAEQTNDPQAFVKIREKIERESLDIISRIHESLNSQVGIPEEKNESPISQCLTYLEKRILTISERIFTLTKNTFENDEKSDFISRVDETKSGDAMLVGRLVFPRSILKPKFFDNNQKTPIILSATLSVNNNFESIKTSYGIDEVVEDIIPSHFNLGRNLLWYVPTNKMTSYSNANLNEYSLKVSQAVEDMMMLTEGGTLALFTSIRQLKETAEYIRDRGRVPYKLFIQNEQYNRDGLINEFKKDEKSCLLATRSFFQGVDVPGISLKSLIIDKLPFEFPNDPTIKAEQCYYKLKGKNFFKDRLLPTMIRTLKQATGRLLRHESDWGVVTVLDSRILSSGKRSYGKIIINSFPDDLIITVDDKYVERFLSQHETPF